MSNMKITPRKTLINFYFIIYIIFSYIIIINFIIIIIILNSFLLYYYYKHEILYFNFNYINVIKVIFPIF